MHQKTGRPYSARFHSIGVAAGVSFHHLYPPAEPSVFRMKGNRGAPIEGLVEPICQGTEWPSFGAVAQVGKGWRHPTGQLFGPWPVVDPVTGWGASACAGGRPTGQV